MGEGSWIGLDVHASSTVAAVISGESGEVVVCRTGVRRPLGDNVVFGHLK